MNMMIIIMMMMCGVYSCVYARVLGVYLIVCIYVLRVGLKNTADIFVVAFTTSVLESVLVVDEDQPVPATQFEVQAWHPSRHATNERQPRSINLWWSEGFHQPNHYTVVLCV